MNGTKRPEMDGTKRPEMDGTKRPRRWDANASTNSIRVLGAKASCPCVAIDDLPLTLGPNEMKPIRVRLVAGSVAGVQRESAVLLFDDSTPRITLGVTAFVHPNP